MQNRTAAEGVPQCLRNLIHAHIIIVIICMVRRIICVRETRVTGILCHVLIGLSVLSIEKLKLIPRPVLDGLFLYLAITALHRNQLFERIVLLFTEQVHRGQLITGPSPNLITS